MDGLLTLTLEAHHTAGNCHRWYEVRVGRDLLGDWTVCLAYGRTGSGGQHKRFAGADPGPLRACVRDHLLRRLSAPRRIGCCYRVTGTHVAAGFDAGVWLPADVMGRFGPPSRPVANVAHDTREA